LDFRGALKSNGIVIQPKKGFFELPISNLRWRQNILPWGGGGYFRIIPSYIFVKGVQQILKKEKTYLFYMHPWEFDPEQPRVKEVSRQLGFRHYINLEKSESKLRNLMKSFAHCNFVSCSEYLKLKGFLS
jgi:hypothetical protein